MAKKVHDPTTRGRHMRLWLAVLLSILGMLIVATVLGALAQWLVHADPSKGRALGEVLRLPRGDEVYDVGRLVFGGVAAIGAIIALTVAVRRQSDQEYRSRLAAEDARLARENDRRANEAAESDGNRIAADALRADDAAERDRIRALTDRYGSAAGQLGHGQAAVRLAGVYAMEAVADEWEARRQQCINVLCAYLRLPYDGPSESWWGDTTSREWTVPDGHELDDGRTVPEKVSNAVRTRHGEDQVRQAIVRVIADHLKLDSVRKVPSWSTYSLDFRGARLEDASFSFCVFAGPTLFDDARFVGQTYFEGAQITHSLSLNRVVIEGTTVFQGARVSGSLHGKDIEILAGHLLDFTVNLAPKITARVSGTIRARGAVLPRYQELDAPDRPFVCELKGVVGQIDLERFITEPRPAQQPPSQPPPQPAFGEMPLAGPGA